MTYYKGWVVVGYFIVRHWDKDYADYYGRGKFRSSRATATRYKTRLDAQRQLDKLISAYPDYSRILRVVSSVS